MDNPYEWKEYIRYFTLKEYKEQTEDFFYSGKWMQSDGSEIRVVKGTGIYVFNQKYNTIPDVIVGRYLGCGPINSGAYVSPEEVIAQFK